MPATSFPPLLASLCRGARIGAAAAAAFLAASCGGTSGANTCEDAVNAVNACAAKFGVGSPGTLEECQAVTCRDKQAAIDCALRLPCGTNAAAYEAAAEACLTANGCH